MARYDYKCTSCGNVFEVEHPMSETPEVPGIQDVLGQRH